MTYISIPGGLAQVVDAGDVLCFPSMLVGFETARQMYVAPEIWDAVADPFDEELIEFRAQLDAFVEGGFLTVAESPFMKPSDAMLARVHPVSWELWDLRSVVPHPGVRCLGGFWQRDVFVALSYNYRENMRWQQDIDACRSRWTDLFGERSPFRGASLDDYLTCFDAV